MSDDIAKLGFSVDTTDIEKAQTKLDKMADSSAVLETAVDKMSKATESAFDKIDTAATGAAAAQKNLTDTAQKLIDSTGKSAANTSALADAHVKAAEAAARNSAALDALAKTAGATAAALKAESDAAAAAATAATKLDAATVDASKGAVGAIDNIAFAWDNAEQAARRAKDAQDKANGGGSNNKTAEGLNQAAGAAAKLQEASAKAFATTTTASSAAYDALSRYDKVIISVAIGMRAASMSGEEMAKAINDGTFALQENNKQLDATDKALDLVKKGFAALGIGIGIRELVHYVDTYGSLQAQLHLVTGSQQEFTAAWQDLYAVSQKTAQSLKGTIELYGRLARSAKDLGLTQSQLVGITDTINKTLLISKTPAASAEAALLQLSQAFASGALRGQELNSVMEQAPRLSQAIAEGLGVSIGALRKMGAEGELTAEKVAGALIKSKEAVDNEFKGAFVGVSGSLVRLQNALTDIVGRADAAAGASASFGNTMGELIKTIESPAAFNALTKAFEAVATVLSAVGTAVLFLLDHFEALTALIAGGKLLGALSGLIGLTVKYAVASQAAAVAMAEMGVAATASKTALAGLGAVLAANPIGLILTAVAAAVALYIAFSSSSNDAEEATTAFNRTIQETGRSAQDYTEHLKALTAAQQEGERIDFTKQLKDQAKAMDQLAQSAADVVLADLSNAVPVTNGDSKVVDGYIDAINGQIAAMKSGKGTAEEFIKTYDDIAKALGVTGKRFDDFHAETVKVANSMKAQGDEVNNLQARLDILNGVNVEAAEKILGVSQALKDQSGITAKAAEEWKTYIDKLESARDVVGKTKAQEVEYESVKKGFGAERAAYAKAVQAETDALTDYEKALSNGKTADAAAAKAKLESMAEVEAKSKAALEYQIVLSAQTELLRRKGLDASGAEADAAKASADTYAKVLETSRNNIAQVLQTIDKNTKPSDKLQNKSQTQAEELKKYVDEQESAIKYEQLLAAAQLKGADAVRAITEQREAEKASIEHHNAGVTLMLDLQTRLNNAKDRAEVSAVAANLNKESDELNKQATATAAGTDALQKYNIEKVVTAALAGKNAAAIDKETEAALRAAAAANKLAQDRAAVATTTATNNTNAGFDIGAAKTVLDHKDDIDGGTKALAEYNAQKQLSIELAGKSIEADSAEGKALKDSIEAANGAKDALAAANDLKEKLSGDGAFSDLADNLRESFSGAGDALGILADKLGDIMEIRKRQVALEKEAQDAAKAGGNVDKLNAQIRLQAAQAQIGAYGTMVGAAKAFFKEGSKGYNALAAAEKVFRTVELAMALKNAAVQIFQIEAITGAKLTAIGEETTANLASVAPNVAADGAKSTSAGILAFAKTLASLPFPANVAAGAAVLALLAAVGVAIGGGGGGSSSVPISEQRQAEQGTGTVMGDATAKSESIKNSIDALKDVANINLKYTSQMLMALRSIDNSIKGIGTLIYQNGSLDLAGSVKTGTTPNAITSLSTSIDKTLTNLSTKIFGSALGGMLGSLSSIGGALFGKVAGGLFGSTKTSVVDSGLYLGAQNVGDVVNSGSVDLSQYADVKKTKKSWFSSSSSTKTQYAGADSDLEKQFGLAVSGIYDAIAGAAGAMGKDVDAVKKTLDAVTLNVGKISLDGLSGDKIGEALQAVFGKIGDQLATAALPELKLFQNLGEGFLETIVRVGSAFEDAKFKLAKFDIAIISLADVMEKNGDIGAQLVRQSIAVVESSNGVLNGVGDIILTLDGTADDIIDVYASLVDVRNAMIDTGAAGTGLTRAMIQAAGGIDTLTTGVKQYYEDYFTDSEKVAAQTKRMTDQFGKLGLTLPATRDDFRKLVEGIDLSSEAGQTLYGQLMSLVPAFSDLTSAQEDYYDKLKSLGDDFRQWLDNQLLGTSSVLTPQEKLLEAQKQFSTGVTAARGGDTDAAANVTKYADQLLSIGRDFYASSSEYTALVEMTRKTVENLGNQLGLPGFDDATTSTTTGDVVQFRPTDTSSAPTTSTTTQADTTQPVVRAIALSSADQVAQLAALNNKVDEMTTQLTSLTKVVKLANERP